jgi:hypothetical protein
MESSSPVIIDHYLGEELSPAIRQILTHLCELEQPNYGSIVEWCETRGDCTQAVICPHCNEQFVIDADEFAELQRVSVRTDQLLSCGVRFD